MADVGRELADRELRKLERKLSHEYAQAEKELRKKREEFTKEYQKELKKKKASLEKGELTKERYKQWLEQQALYESWVSEMADYMASEQVNVNRRAAEIMNNATPKVYAEAFNFGTFLVEDAVGIDTMFALYNADTVARLMKDNPKLLPEASIDVPKDKRWNYQKMKTSLVQSILQGESVSKMAKRLRRVTDMNKTSAVRNARTMFVGAENSGRFDSFQRAIGLGIEMKKMWSATMDSRTRNSHAILDGETVELNEKFSNGLMYPGDPDGAPSEVYNCRCRLSAQLAGFERNNRHIVDGENVTEDQYRIWKDERTRGLNSVTNFSKTARTKEEFERKASSYNKHLRNFFGHEGRWNGGIIVDATRTDSSGRLLDDGRLLVSPYASDTVIAHELTHSYSSHKYTSVDLDRLGLRFVEEATVSYFSENFVKSMNGIAGKAYPKLTERLYVLNKALNLAQTDYAFSRELIKVSIEQRHDYLKKKAISAMMARQSVTRQQVLQLEKYIDDIKGGLGYV